MSARQILDTVWLVGSGTDESAFTDRYDCHCYLLWDGMTGLLIDAGTGRGADRWLSNVCRIAPLERLAGVFLTHYHADHAGGAAAARTAGLTVAASATTASALLVGDEQATQLARAREAGLYPADYTLPPTAVERVLTDGEVLHIGDFDLKVVDTPGHCDGHLGYMVHTVGVTVLFSGDCVFAEGKVSILAIPDCRLDRYAATVQRLSQHQIETLLPGHGPAVLSMAAVDIDRAARQFARLIPPKNFSE